MWSHYLQKNHPQCFHEFFDQLFAFVSIPGATVDAKTHAGLTALHLASECGHTSVVCALLDHNRNGGCPSLYNSKASIDTLESAARYVLITCFHEFCYYESANKPFSSSNTQFYES
jgi:ankyrin repeat protein